MKDRKKRENKPSITKDYLPFPRNLAPGIPVSRKKRGEKYFFRWAAWEDGGGGGLDAFLEALISEVVFGKGVAVVWCGNPD